MATSQVSSQANNEQLKSSLEYQQQLNSVYRDIHEADRFEDVLPHLEKGLLSLVRAERLTVYRRARNGREIVSRYKTGVEVNEIRLPLTPTSIASFVALSQLPLRIDNVYDTEHLVSLHPKLKFDHSYDQRTGFRTRSMMVVPIKFNNTMLGVLQVMNRVGEVTFAELDLMQAQEVAQIIGQKFQYDLQATRGPFDYLLHRKVITPEKLKEAESQAAKENSSVAYCLLKEFRLTPDEIGESLEHYYQIPFFKYDPDIELPGELLKKLNTAYLKANCWVPIAGDQDKATILIDNPNDSNRIMEIQQGLNVRSYEFRVGLVEDILRYLGEGIESISESRNAVNLDDLVGRLRDEVAFEEDDEDGETISSVSENEATVVQLVNRLILDASKYNASDIHIEPGKGKENANVRMRIDGVCRRILRIPSSHIRAVIARIKIMSRLDIAERRKPQDGKIATMYKGKPIELRVATLPTVNGESAVLRVLSSGDALPFDKLNLSERNEKAVLELISKPHGIFLVVGPTGSGKTTTLHAILGHINSPDRKIWTAEDPVEITQPGLQQVQVNPKIGFDFATALRAFLRADPDVILIGEMRDQETSHIGVEASLTGHLVFSTLHTNSAPESITRLLDLGLDPLSFADALLGILAQRLLLTLCSNCKQPYMPSDHEYEQLAKAYGEENFSELGKTKADLKLYKAVGCDECGGSGYKGRTGIHELLVSSPEMRSMIAKNGLVAEIRDLAIQEGMRSLMQDGIAKVLRGQADFIHLRRVTAE
jgi:type II secretory ATPase GspE/PulE/Tfp pilus assembly ATPase PilB-like protein